MLINFFLFFCLLLYYIKFLQKFVNKINALHRKNETFELIVIKYVLLLLLHYFLYGVEKYDVLC
jgi:hypothetical protein